MCVTRLQIRVGIYFWEQSIFATQIRNKVAKKIFQKEFFLDQLFLVEEVFKFD